MGSAKENLELGPITICSRSSIPLNDLLHETTRVQKQEVCFVDGLRGSEGITSKFGIINEIFNSVEDGPLFIFLVGLILYTL